MYPIRLMMKKERRMMQSPIMAKVSVFFAPSTCLGSPPEVTSLIAEMIIKKRATTPANISAARTIFSKTTGIHFSVAISFTIQPGILDQSLNID